MAQTETKTCERCGAPIPHATGLKRLFPFEEFLCDACDTNRRIEERNYVASYWFQPHAEGEPI